MRVAVLVLAEITEAINRLVGTLRSIPIYIKMPFRDG